MCDALAAATRRLAAAGVEGPRAEARRLLEAAAGVGRERLLAAPEAPLPPEAAAAFARAVDRRAAREPFAYVVGRREFHGRDFAVGPGVLVPRPETETLVEAALAAFPDRTAPLRVLDMGVGSGCLLLTVLSLYPNARGTGTDLSPAALATAAANARALGVADRASLVAASWGDGLEPAFDLVLANPPYVATAEIEALEPEVAAHEPRLALDGGPDGLDAYRALTPGLLRLLAPEGAAFLEIGRGQDAPLAAWFAARGLAVAFRRDLAGIVRCLELRYPSAGRRAGEEPWTRSASRPSTAPAPRR
jgi:release factor glutamine methyltransferase